MIIFLKKVLNSFFLLILVFFLLFVVGGGVCCYSILVFGFFWIGFLFDWIRWIFVELGFVCFFLGVELCSCCFCLYFVMI